LNDESWMELAFSLAESAESFGDVPVGAVIIRNNSVVSSGFNTRELQCNPLGHAELNAIKSAAQTLGTWRLSDCTLYVTLEPCLMCAGALYQARIGKIVYGARDIKAGAIESLFQIHQDSRLNHRYGATGGVLEVKCSGLLTRFFKRKRESKVLL
jgi:tRNA(adenine34) deaminase